MISVIIPALDESKTIGAVVEFARRDPLVSEVLVIDDGSIDGTPQHARSAGARVILSSLRGKGASMEDGLRAARNEVLLFLDADLSGLSENLIECMTRPIFDGEADFVKARFSRSSGRVTVLAAQPLLRAFFPELSRFEQPLGGIIAVRRGLLCQLDFEDDYGVDIGLLIDAAAVGARLAEVDIGHVEHKSQPLEALGKMAGEVVRSILQRAARYGRLRSAQVRRAAEIDQYPQAGLAGMQLGTAQRFALLDMDGVLLKGRYIDSLARWTGRSVELAAYLDNYELSAEERTSRIAALLAGVPRSACEEVARGMPLTLGARETVLGLRKAGYGVGIVTDSFQPAAEVVARRVFADFAIGHALTFRRGKATGHVTLAPAMAHAQGCAQHAYCKANVLHHLAARTGVGPDRMLAVGDSENDICLLRAAGESIAFQPRKASVQAAARYVIHGDLSRALTLIDAVNTSGEPAVLPLVPRDANERQVLDGPFENMA